VAMAAVLITVPFTLGWGLAAFASFRLFDIWKPFSDRLGRSARKRWLWGDAG